MSWRGDLPVACWTAGEAVNIIPVEAESTSDGVFLATHTSIPIIRRDHVGSAEGGALVTEEELKQAVEELPQDQPIIPILGKSGTGKSHLVRWLRAKLDPKESTRLIFVPKHRMSLRGILELILVHATSERAEELRAKVATAVDAASDEREARLRLRSTLAILVETRGTRADRSPEESELREYLASPEGLPALLNDPVFRDRLLDEAAPIARLVREKLSGKGADDKEDAYGFAAADLDLSVDDIGKAGESAQTVAAALASDTGLRELAAMMLNEQLGPAVGEVFGIGGDDLKQLLVELRLDLQRQGLDLLLLIEDFSIFQGIQGGLIDAITLVPTADVPLCPMRVVMAVTTGYFVNQMPETVFTRTYKVFDLAAPAKGSGPFDPAAFAARYLNAVRVGAAEIDTQHADARPAPNGCERCPVREKCHRAFGQVDDIGLFPFNRTALALAMRSQAPDGEFVARDVLTRVLRPVLQRDQVELDERRFPGDAFENDFRTGALDVLDNIEDQVQLHTPGDRELSDRRVRMVRFWGSDQGAHNLDPAIHEAFGVPPLEVLATPRTARQESRPKHEAIATAPAATVRPSAAAGGQATSQPAQDPALVQAVDHWRATGKLVQSSRNDLRNIVHAAIIGHLNLEDGYGGDGGWAKGDKKLTPQFLAASSISLDGSASQSALVSLDHTDDNDVRVLRALAWAHTAQSWSAVPNGATLQRLCMQWVETRAAQVSEALLPQEDDDPELARLAHALLAAGKALGIPDAFKDDPLSRVRAIFAVPPTVSDTEARPRLRRWQSDIVGSDQKPGRDVLRQRLLRLTCYRQGTGEPLALNLPRLLRAVHDDSAHAIWPGSVPAVIRESVENIGLRIGALDQLRDEAVALVPDTSDMGGDVSKVSKALNGLISGLAPLGLSSSAVNGPELLARARSVQSGDLKTTRGFEQSFAEWESLGTDERLRTLTSDVEGPSGRVQAWLQPTLAAVRSLEAKLQAGPLSETQREHEEALTLLLAKLTELDACIVATTTSPGEGA
ncbi:protein DpdH [Kitasatospora sp. NPDC008115]|uniref:protein DpdH n=1 Tax=Kitasatospora sp. NPDC008115 TaxID=3364022 RepID=UPI0036EE6B4B